MLAWNAAMGASRVVASAGVLLTLAKRYQASQVQLGRNVGQGLAADQRHQPLGERAFLFMRVVLIKQIGDHQRQDPVAKSIAEARVHWHRMYALPSLRQFHMRVPSYFIRDDHDTLKDDCWPGQIGRAHV